MHKRLQNLSLQDLEIISILPRYQSLRALARDMRTTASSISGKISFFEQELDLTIVTRSARGYSLTKDGAQLAKVAGEILRKCESLVSLSGEAEAEQKWLTFGSRGFINSLFAPIIAQAVERNEISVNFRFVDFSPQELVVAAFRSSLDVAITLEECFLGERWLSRKIGETRRVFLARSGHPLEQENISALKNFRVLRSVFWDGNSVVSLGDPLPSIQKRIGCELQTAATAIPVILNTDCVAYLPRLAVARALTERQVIELFSKQFEAEAMPVFLHINKDTISQKLNQTLFSIATKTLDKFG